VLALLSITLLTTQSVAQYSEAGSQVGTSAPPPVFTPNVLPVLSIRPTASDIVIDGVVSDQAWNFAAQALNFSEIFPGDRAEPPIGIKAYMTYDASNLYVAFKIKDDPAQIRANLSDRDDFLGQDDFVGLILDTNQDGQSLYFIAVNPLGVQGDTRISVNNEDEGFDLIYDAEARITDTGYEVEMAIPFKSLRFPNSDIQQWRANFLITRPRTSRSQYSWSAIDRDNPCWTCQIGMIRGIQGVSNGRNLEILPALTGGSTSQLRDANAPTRRLDHGRISLNPSIHVKYGLTSQLTADFTVNPDFSQIEADAAQIDVNSTFALSYDERRPFFQEGAELFMTNIRTVYTRSINEPIVAGKLTGRWGNTDIAYIGARDETSPLLMPFEESSRLLSAGRSVSNILRIKQNLPGNSYIGALLTDRRLDIGGAGSTIGIDGQLRFLGNYRLSAQVVASLTTEANNEALSKQAGEITFGSQGHTAALDGETFGGLASSLNLSREGRYWGFRTGYSQSTPTFRADNGFVRQNSVRRIFIWQGATLYPKKVIPLIDRIRPGIAVGRRWNYDGLHKNDFFAPSIRLQMKAQTNFQARYTFERERFAGRLFEGVQQLRLNAFSNFSEYASLSAQVSTGRDIGRFLANPVLGNSLNVFVSGTIRPNQHLSLQPRLSYSRLRNRTTGENYFSGYIARARIGYQFSRRFFSRTVAQYNDFNKSLDIDLLISYKLNAFTAVHLGSTHDLDQFERVRDDASKYFRERNRQIFFKVQYLVRT